MKAVEAAVKGADPVLGATALALAAELDDPDNSATSKSMCARALNETMREIRDLCPPEREVTRVDEIREQYEKRRGRSAS